MGGDAAFGFFMRQGKDRVAGAAKLECADLLKIFAFKKKFGVRKKIKALTGKHRGSARIALNSFCRRADRGQIRRIHCNDFLKVAITGLASGRLPCHRKNDSTACSSNMPRPSAA